MAEVLSEKLLVLPETGNILESLVQRDLMLAFFSSVLHFLNRGKFIRETRNIPVGSFT